MSITDVVAAAGFVVTAAGASLAFWQLREGKNIARAQFVLSVDQALASFEDLRRSINANKALTEDEALTLRRYVAVFERVGLLLEGHHLDIQLVDELYGSRLEKLLLHREHLVTFVTRKPNSWRGFIYLWTELRRHRPSLPDPPAASVRRRERWGPKNDST